MVAPPETRDRELLLMARASKLRVDAASAEVMRRFAFGGVEVRLLKGPSIAQWLYPNADPRPYVDCDLLVAPAGLQIAGEILASMGYACLFDDRAMPAWWREHAGVWARKTDGLTVDLHRTLAGVGVDDGTAWDLLSATPASVMVAGEPLPALGLTARALHVALHAAQHGADRPQSMADLDRALALGDNHLWLEAAELAGKLGAMDAFVGGLGLTTTGQQLVSRLGLPASRSTDSVLRAGSPPPLALGFEQLARASGVRLRVEIVWRKIVPPAAFVRHWDPRAAGGRLALLRAYLRRPLWLLRLAPGGLRAWRKARRAVRLANRDSEP